MKINIKKNLKEYPYLFSILKKCYRFIWSLLVKIYRVFVPGSDYYTKKLKKQIQKTLRYQDSIFFQVGSNDGKQGDPLHDIIVNSKNWKGIFIEPVSFLFERLKNNYGNYDRFIFEKQAISTSKSIAEFYYVSERAKIELGNELPYWYDQLGSFNKNHILKYLNGLLEPYIVTVKYPNKFFTRCF